MKKQLLMGAFLLGSFLTASAQDSCANAIEITSDGTLTSAAISGEYGPTCWGGTTNQQQGQGPLLANWYSYTPSANGLLTISSAIAANPVATTDTRLSVFTGTCTALECYNGSDDVAGDDYRTELTIPVESGVTYYIAWDNNWSSAGFDFSVAFEAADCLSPNSLTVEGFSNIDVNSATFTWGEAINSPGGYDVAVGEVGFDPATEGMMFETTTTSVDITGLTVTNNDPFYVYLRSDCGESQAEWIGPYALYLPANLDYSYGFEAGVGAGWTRFDNTATGGGNWNSVAAVTALGFTPYEGDLAVRAGATTAADDAWLFSRPVNIGAGETVTLRYYTAKIIGAGTGGVNSLKVSVGTGATVAEQTTVLADIEEITNTDWQLNEVSYTATEAGIYYFSFNYIGNVQSASSYGWAAIDDVQILNATASNEDFVGTQLSVFPNPANNVVNILNANNTLVNAVEIVDLNGRTVKSVKFDGVSEAQINISELSSGVYMMNIATDNGSVTKKIVKN